MNFGNLRSLAFDRHPGINVSRASLKTLIPVQSRT